MQPAKFSKKSILFLFLSAVCLAAGIYIYLTKKSVHKNLPEITNNGRQEAITINSNFFFDLETTEGLSGIDNIKPTTAHSGKMACDLSGGKEFGVSVIKKISDAGIFPMKRTAASVWVYPLSDHPDVVLTATISNSKNETVFWDGKSTEKMEFPKNKWTKINALYNFPVEKLSPDDVLQINIWNKGKTNVIIDDLEVVYGECNERRGTYSNIDANEFYEKRFTAQRNKPPFPIIYFEKQEINNNNSTLLIPTDSLTDLSPNDEFLTGDFIIDENNIDELVYSKNGKIIIAGYSNKKKGFQIYTETTETELQPLWKKTNKKFAGDFNADGITDLLIVNTENGSWKLFNLKSNNWNEIASGAIGELTSGWMNTNNKPFVSDLFSENKKDALVILDNYNCKTLQFNKISKTFEEKKTSLNTSDTSLFKTTSIIHTGSFTGNNEQEIVRYITEWRFDLKLMQLTPSAINMLGTVDFKGYPNDYNPKYYEFLKIIPGKFINPQKTALLVIMRNCADTDFNGEYCKEFENISYLPNCTQLYCIENEK